MPSIIDRITALFRRDHPKTTADEVVRQRPRPAADLISKLRSSNERAAIIKDSRTMYQSDTRAESIMQTLARDAVAGGFMVDADDDNAIEIAHALRDRLKLNGRLDDWSRLTFRDGDTFLEIGVTNDLKIVDVTRKPTLLMHRNTDKADRFEDPSEAFWLSERAWLNDVPRDALWFAEWQIIHARWNHDEGNRYGRPLLASAIKSWKRMNEGELDMAVRRKTRAGMKYLHVVEGADVGGIELYKELNKSALDNPFAAAADFFTNKPGSISAIQGDARLNDIADVQHHIHTFWLGSPVPMGIVGYGTDIDFSVIGHQKEQYDETLIEVQSWVTDQFVRPLIERQWLLAGILPDHLTYEIKWTPKKRVTAADIEKLFRAALAMRALGLPEETIAIILTWFLPGIEPDMLMTGNNSNGQVDTERLVNIATSLMRGMDGPKNANAGKTTLQQ